MPVTFSTEWASAVPWWHLVLGGLGVFAAGVSSGAVGIGGVIVVPLLVASGAVPDTKHGIAAAAAAFFICNCTGSVLFLRMGQMPGLARLLPIAAGATAAAFLSTFVVQAIEGDALADSIAALAAASGLFAVYRACQPLASSAGPGVAEEGAPAAAEGDDSPPSPSSSLSSSGTGGALLPPLVVNGERPASDPGAAGAAGAGVLVRRACGDVLLGAVTGLGSGLTGTGGPFILMPLQLCFAPRREPREAVGLCLAVGAPMCLLAATSQAVYATLDAPLAAAVGVLVALGQPCGARAARRAEPRALRGAVGALLATVGAGLIVKYAVV